jgi:acyl-CoA reductase-like NAD-dependent aldehyde dehydrogenase
MGQGVRVDDQDNSLVNVNPANGQVISHVPCTTAAAVDEALARATHAQLAWGSTTNVAQRVALLQHGLANLGERSNELARLVVHEMGKPLSQAVAEVEGAVHKEEYLQLLLQALEPQQHGTSIVVREPYGVVVILSPWNFPVDEILLLALPALASGNSVIVKPSEVTPESGQLVVETLASVLPDGVLQVVQGDGVVGEQLVQHAATKLIAMTGSSATGKKIAAQAALGLKRVVLELGGKDPMLVFADANLEAAAGDAVAFSLENAGQVCCSMERIYVADAIYDDFVRAVHRQAKTHTVGNGMDKGVTVGPLVSCQQRDHAQAQVCDALAKGATLVYQSELPAHAPAEASFFPVTVLSHVTPNMLIAREETFGPVVCLTPFDGSEEAAVALANDTVYGLAAAVYSQDETKAQRVAAQIQAGQVGINCYAPSHMNVACPWVGHKESGLGYHSGVEGFHNFSIPKSLVFKPSS